MFKVYAYTRNQGDDSYGIYWFLDDHLDEDRFVDYQFESWCDGDGCGPKWVLTFNSKEEAVKAGIPAWIDYFKYGED